jgi:hypothetical protein
MVFPLPILLAAVLLVAAPSANRSDELLRAPWTRGSERFERQWLPLGPLPAAHSIEPPSAPATPGQLQALSDGRTLRWNVLPLLEQHGRPHDSGGGRRGAGRLRRLSR